MNLTIFTDLPSTNKRERMHWAKRARLRATILTELKVALMGQTLKPVKREKVKKCVTITLYRKGRRFDKDNSYGATKPVTDSLRKLGLIWNDSEAWLDLGVAQKLDHRNPRIEIEIKDFK